MYYYSTSYDTYLAHHGVKGMKWGVHRYAPFKSKHLGKQRSRGSMLAYTKVNRKGVEKQKSMTIGILETRRLKKKGVINKDGTISPENRERVRKYVKTAKAIDLALAGGMLVVNGAAVAMAASKMPLDSMW